MRKPVFSWLSLCFGLVFTVGAVADVTTTGDVSPTPDANGGTTAGPLSIGNGSSNGNTFFGSMVVNGGTVLTSNDGIIGNRVGSNGTVFVEGQASEWFSSDDLQVGNDGYGELSVSRQARVGNTDDFSIGVLAAGRGWVTVDGNSSILDIGDQLSVGAVGVGNLSASNRSRIVSNTGTVGEAVDGIGNVTISREATWRVRSNLIVAEAGVGTLTINEGGFVENATARIGSANTGIGRAVVSGSGSVWLSRNDLLIGERGSGELLVEDRGLVQVNDDITLNRRGRLLLDEGRVTADVITNEGVIEGGGRIEGTLDIAASGSVRANGESPLIVNATTTNAGSIEALDGELEFERAVTNTGLIAGRDGTLRFNTGLTNNGKLGFSAGATDVFGDVTNSATGQLQVGGEGVATFYGTFSNSGSISVEPQANAVFIGNVAQAANAAIALAGLAVDPLEDGELSVNDPMHIGGTLTADGTLTLRSSSNPFDVTEPSERGTGVRLSLITAGQISGSFSQVSYDQSLLSPSFPGADGGFRSLDAGSDLDGMFRSLSYGTNSIDLTNYLALEGDTDGDRDVDFADFLQFSDNFGKAGDWLAGDFSGDGMVSFPDFLVLSANFGTSAAAASYAVPEPAAISYLGWCAIVLLTRRRRAA